MIFKAQVSLMSSDGKKHLLLYDKKRKYQWEEVIGKGHELLKLMRGAPKMFFKGHLRPDPANGGHQIVIDKPTVWQDW